MNGTTIFGMSKTTLAGILSAVMATTGPVAGMLGAIQSVRPTPNYELALAIAGLTCLASILRAWLGMVQGDAPIVPVTTTTTVATPGTVPITSTTVSMK